MERTAAAAASAVWSRERRRALGPNFVFGGRHRLGGLRLGGNFEVSVREGCTTSIITQIIFKGSLRTAQ